MTTSRIYNTEIETFARTIPIVDSSDIQKTRDAVTDYRAHMESKGFARPSDPSIEETETTIPGPPNAPDIKIRIYTPNNLPNPAPAYINFHGGGFIFGDLDSEHARTLAISKGCQAIAITVDYRLAPEHPYPAAIEDCYASLIWSVNNAKHMGIDTSRIIVGGGSAGGNLAASVALMARDKHGPSICYQMLIYPALDDRANTKSMLDGKNTYVITSQNVLDMWNYYLGHERINVPYYAAPSRASDLSNLPPAYVMTCQHDPLRDEAIIYAMRLMDAGVPVELHNYPGTVHGFDYLIPCDISERAIRNEINMFNRAIHK